MVDQREPIVIAGLGGSGTRVVADMVRRVGYHLGEDLNRSLDNLWFTLLFRRPDWWARQRGRRGFDRNLRVFLHSMHGEFSWTPATVIAVAGAYRDLAEEYGHEWLHARIGSMRRAAGPADDAQGWGWKEPNTHVVLLELIDALPSIRYIHVIRDGLDMAFSDNQQQLHRWGPLFGIPEGGLSQEERSARYWLAANKRALEIGRAKLGGRFHVVDFDRMCRDPDGEVSGLLGLLGLGSSYIPTFRHRPRLNRIVVAISSPTTERRRFRRFFPTSMRKLIQISVTDSVDDTPRFSLTIR